MIKVYKIKVGEKLYEVEVESVSEKQGTLSSGAVASEAKSAPAASAPQSSGSGEKVEAPMQGLVVGVSVTVGQKVSAGDTLVIIEAMKMENPMVSPIDGTVTSIVVSKGDTVDGGDLLVTIG